MQDDRFDADSVTICPFTADPADAPLFRLVVEPDDGDALNLNAPLGALDGANVSRLNRALVVFLGIAGSVSR